MNKGVTSTVKCTIKPVSAEDVNLQFVALNFSKSTGTDNIHAQFLKDGKGNVTTPLCNITNHSILSGEISQELK